MHTFIHARADAQMVLRLVQGRAVEDQHIEFKAFWGPWTPMDDKKSGEERRYEAVKDIAAMANALGGDIIVGVAEEQGRASGFAPLPRIKDGAGQVAQWAASYLVPHEVSRGIQVREQVIETASGSCFVAVVSVPACTHGPVAVRLDRGGNPSSGVDPGQHRSFAIPRRVGTATHFLDVREGAVVAQEEQRRLYLTALQLVGEQNVRVHLTAATYVQVPGQRVFWRTAGGMDSNHGWIKRKDISETSLVMLSGPHNASIPMTDGRPLWLNEGGGKNITLPYSEVRDIWRDAGSPDVLNISMRGCLVWDGFNWRISDQPPTETYLRGV